MAKLPDDTALGQLPSLRPIPVLEPISDNGEEGFAPPVGRRD